MTDTTRFADHAVLITGAARGIGAAVARRLAEEGARVLLTDRDGPEVEETAARLRGLGHTASCTPDTPLFEDDPADAWDRDLDITLTGTYRCCRAALPHLAASGRGAIVSIGSVNGLQDFGNHAYSAAKAGLGSLTRTLAGHAAARGVRVNLVTPGTVRTSAWEGRDADLEAIRPLYPLGRIGEPEDIAAAVAFLASRDAAWITGTTLVVDGGLTAVNTGFRAARGGWDDE